MYWHQQSKRSTSTSRSLKINRHLLLPPFLRTPKPLLRRSRRKNDFGVSAALYAGTIGCPRIEDRSYS